MGISYLTKNLFKIFFECVQKDGVDEWLYMSGEWYRLDNYEI